MTTDVEKAAAFKDEGNAAFKAHDWNTAIEKYTKAIELNGKEPTYYSNRAQVHDYPISHITSEARVTDLRMLCPGKYQAGVLWLRHCRC
jgi:Tfp pilus assembly protein PilF